MATVVPSKDLLLKDPSKELLLKDPSEELLIVAIMDLNKDSH